MAIDLSLTSPAPRAGEVGAKRLVRVQRGARCTTLRASPITLTRCAARAGLSRAMEEAS
jgi:hypothetical protein